jgi:ribonuclease BN (tRNA processing enzyme)
LVELIVLGSSASVPDAEHDTVSLVLRGPDWAVLVECGGSPLHKLAQLGVDLEDLRAVILTHRHPGRLPCRSTDPDRPWIGRAPC